MYNYKVIELQKHCAICGRDAEQQHHLSYDPEIVIAVCKVCHLRLHTTHGVGSAKGDKLYGPTKTKYLVELAIVQAQELNQAITNVLGRQPIYTDVILDEQGRTTIV